MTDEQDNGGEASELTPDDLLRAMIELERDPRYQDARRALAASLRAMALSEAERSCIQQANELREQCRRDRPPLTEETP